MSKTSIQTNNGFFWSAEEGGGNQGEMIHGRPKGLAVADRQVVGSDQELFTIHRKDDRIAFESQHGFFLCAELDGTLVFNRREIGGWELFRVVPGLEHSAFGGVAFITDHNTYVQAENSGGGKLRHVSRDSVNADETFYSTIKLIGTGGGTGPDEPIGDLTPLRVEGRLFANESGFCDYREVSAFAALELFRQNKIEHLKELCRVLRSYRVNALRVILTLGGSYWENVIGLTSGPNNEGFYEALNPFVRFMATQGFYVRLCLIGGLESFGGFSREREDVYSSSVHSKVVPYIHNVLHHTRDEPNVLYNIANEWNQIGMRDSDHRIVELGQLVKNLAPHRLMNLTETNGPIADDPMWARRPADFVDAHLERWTGVGGFSWVKRSSESPVVDNGKMLFISGEVINFGTPQPGRPDDAESSPAVAFAYGGTSRVKRYVTNFHYHGGLSAAIPDEATQACMQGWQRGLDAIPLTFPGGWCNGHHSCSPWDINIFPREGENEETHTRGPIRIFGLSGGEGYIGVSIAERAGAGIPAHRRSVQEIDRVTYGGYSSAVYRA